MKRDNIQVNDRQLACAKIDSQEGQVTLAIVVSINPINPPSTAMMSLNLQPSHRITCKQWRALRTLRGSTARR